MVEPKLRSIARTATRGVLGLALLGLTSAACAPTTATEANPRYSSDSKTLTVDSQYSVGVNNGFRLERHGTVLYAASLNPAGDPLRIERVMRFLTANGCEFQPPIPVTAAYGVVNEANFQTTNNCLPQLS